MDLKSIENQVRALLARDNTGHGFEHVERVYKTALALAKIEHAEEEIVALAALLHDADDYKLFGQECADNLTNARMIMNNAGISAEKQAHVCDIIHNMGYSKALKGVRPQTTEGKVISDADMLDAIGALGTIRSLSYALARCDTPIFVRDIWPEVGISAEEYKKPNRRSDNFINHFLKKCLNSKI